MPSLLDAIFGKKDLASVSVADLQEVLKEFPSFNAAHFFLSKKLKDQDDATYVKESLRTALYFNNAFWLQSILEETGREHVPVPATAFQIDSDQPEKVLYNENPEEEIPVSAESVFTGSLFVPDVQETGNDLPDHTLHVPDAMSETDEKLTGSVSSFDDLLSKYKIDEPETAAAEPVAEPVTDHNQSDLENHEVVNEYGIFEEVITQKHDFDMDAFDPPEEIFSPQESLPIEVPDPQILQKENQTIVEPVFIREAEEISDTDDYEAFDRPIDHQEPENPDTEDISQQPESPVLTASEEADDTDQKEEVGQQLTDSGRQMPEIAGLLQDQEKTALSFDPKKAESIVFAPYHMIDYFASQGIKLVLEENPADNFGKQLKSFTDWLKVMKRLPPKVETVHTEQVEAEKIRHFAEHSVEERDILTESMAEVLAKQGMYENAIALYQKLSLIYPPKSAYFASRIEQIKASLP